MHSEAPCHASRSLCRAPAFPMALPPLAASTDRNSTVRLSDCVAHASCSASSASYVLGEGAASMRPLPSTSRPCPGQHASVISTKPRGPCGCKQPGCSALGRMLTDLHALVVQRPQHAGRKARLAGVDEVPSLFALSERGRHDRSRRQLQVVEQGVGVAVVQECAQVGAAVCAPQQQRAVAARPHHLCAQVIVTQRAQARPAVTC